MPGGPSRYPAPQDLPAPAGGRLTGHGSGDEREYGHTSPPKVLAAMKKPFANSPHPA